jgi:hypothetical protein
MTESEFKVFREDLELEAQDFLESLRCVYQHHHDIRFLTYGITRYSFFGQDGCMIIKFPTLEHEAVHTIITQESGILDCAPNGYKFVQSGTRNVGMGDGSLYQPDSSIIKVKNPNNTENHSEERFEDINRDPLIVFETNLTGNLDMAKCKSAKWVLSGAA